MHTSIAELLPNLAVVVVERLEVLVNVGDGASEAQVERPKNPNIPRAETTRRPSICQFNAYKKQLEVEDGIDDYVKGEIITCSPRS